MKNTFLGVMCIMACHTLHAQMPKWCIPPAVISFPGTTPTTSPLPGSVTISYPKASNAAFDQNGNLLFYVYNGQIIQTDGTVVFNPSSSVGSSTEEGIVKVPGYCNRYYVIRHTNPPGNYARLYYNMVEVNGGTVSIVPGFSDVNLGIVGTEFAGMAISKMRPGKTRFLFCVGRVPASVNNGTSCGVKRFRITGNGIHFDADVVPYSTLNTYNEPTEVELYESSNGNMTLAWNNYALQNWVNILSLDNQGNYVSYATRSISALSGSDAIYGLEFYDNGNKLVISYSGSPAGGLAVIDIPGNTVSAIPSSGNYPTSHIEKGPDNNYYVIGYNYSFAKIDPANLTVTHLFNLSQINNYMGPTLPDQVDDEPFTSSANWAADLVMADDALDIALEPNTTSANIWESPDIWNCRSNMGNCSAHQNPGFLSPGSFDNYARVRVINKGCMTSAPAALKMYWTLGSTGETWPNSWNGNIDFCSHDAGGELTPSGGITIPALIPGQGVIVTQAWDPVDPNLFNCINLSTWNDGEPMICMLARIESASDPMFDEQSGAIGPNVKNNNNIVTRNTSLVSMTGSIIGPPGGKSVQVFMQNHLSFAQAFDLDFAGMDLAGVPFNTIGGIRVTLSDELWQEWVNGGMQGTGIDASAGDLHQIEITDMASARLSNITLQAGAFYPFTITFFMTQPSGSLSGYSLSVTQSWFDDDLGANTGSECHVLVSVNEEGMEQRITAGSQEEKVITHQSDLYKDMTIVPNPAHERINISILEDMRGATLYVTNAVGQLVLQETADTDETSMDISTLPPGIYIVKAVLRDRISVKKFVKN